MDTESKRCEATSQNGAALLILGGCAVFLLVVRILLISEGFMPFHDTFARFCAQSVYLGNEPALNYCIPQWDPFLFHGTSKYFIGIDMFSTVCAVVAPVLKSVNRLILCHLSLWFDECILVLGCFLLARRWYASLATAVFVTAAVALTAVSFAQCGFSLSLIYLVPIVLYCGDRVVRNASFRHLACMSMLGVGMVVLNIAYAAPLLAFTLLVFAASLAACAGRRTVPVCRVWFRMFSWRHVLVLAVTGILLALAWCYLRDCAAGVHVFRRENSGSANVSLATFMSYGGCVSIKKYFELIWRYSSNNDLSLYGGMLVVPCLCVALLRARSPLATACGITALTLVLFTSGTVVSKAFYLFFPLGSMFRHIGPSAPLAKMFIVLYAGFGFDALWQSMCGTSTHTAARDRRPLLVIIVALVVLAALVCTQRFHFLHWYVYGDEPTYSHLLWNQIYQTPQTRSLVDVRVLQMLVAYAALLCVTYVAKRPVPALACVLLLFHCVDVASYKIDQETSRPPKVSSPLRAVFNVHACTFAPTRATNVFACSRIAIINDALMRYSVLYNVVQSLGDCDAVLSPFRTLTCEEPIYQFFRVWNTNANIGSSYEKIEKPTSRAFDKACGLALPKLQMFSRMHYVTTDSDAAAILRRDDYPGDILLVAGTDMTPGSGIKIRAFERLTNASMHVRAFSYNRLALDVGNPAIGTSVLYYADAWHPFWRATVNGVATPVMRANIAYKAVAVPPGMSRVEFAFGTPWSTFLVYTIIGIALLSFGTVIWLWIADAILPAAIMRRPASLCAVCMVGVAVCGIVAFSGTVRAGLMRGNLTALLDREIARHAALLAARPDDVGTLVARADLYRQRGDLLAAIADCEIAIARDTNCFPAFLVLSEVYYMRKDYETMAACFVRACHRATPMPLPPPGARNQQAEDILRTIERATRAPMDPGPFFRLAALYLRAGNVPLAAEHFSAVLDRVPVLNDDKAFAARGDICVALGLHEQAIKWYTEALKLKPGTRCHMDSLTCASQKLMDESSVAQSGATGTWRNADTARGTGDAAVNTDIKENEQ